jgi:HSP20 family protein
VTRTEHTRSGRLYRPTVDILERADELVVHADMPGVHHESIDVSFENGTLTIHGSVKDRDAENGTYLLREYGVGDYYRTFQVSETIDAQRIEAAYHDGVLTLRLPKLEAAKARKITVQSA